MNFEYNEIQLPENSFKISPSQIDKFFAYPSVWYKENILKEKTFVASTSTVLGTVVHALAEAYAKGEETSREECDSYIETTARYLPVDHTPINVDEVKSLYPQMSMALINEYIRYNKPTEVEKELKTHIKGHVHLAGTCDNRTGSIVVDYKNVAKKPSETIPFHYKIQLLAYAYMYKKEGINIDTIRIIYTVRPTKTLPVRVIPVSHLITDDDWKLIEDTIELIADTVIMSRDNPVLNYLLFKSMSLKEE